MKASIIIPSFNASERLFYNLLSLSNQDIESNAFEIIVVDNGSTDKTQDMLKLNEFEINIKNIYLKSNKGRAFARNCGINTASGDLIIFHDSDMIAEKSYVRKHIEAHKDKNLVVCGQSWSRVYSYYYRDFAGYLKNNFTKQSKLMGFDANHKFFNKQPLLLPEDIVNGKCFDLSFNLEDRNAVEEMILGRYGEKLYGYKFPWCFFITNNCSVEKRNLIEVGAFDEGFIRWGCEDVEVGYRLYKKGWSFIKNNGIKSIHQEHPIDFMDDGKESILYFIMKYKEIDVLLFYCSQMIQLTQAHANQVVAELETLLCNKDLLWLKELYRSLLLILIDKKYKDYVSKQALQREIIKASTVIKTDKEIILSALDYIETTLKCYFFASSFRSLVKLVLNIKL